MALGELNLYNYSGGMPALSGSPEMNGKVNGTALGKAEKVNGRTYKVAGLSRDLVQVGTPSRAQPKGYRETPMHFFVTAGKQT